MWNRIQQIQHLDDLSERLCDMRKVAAKLEPISEELAHTAKLSKYDHGMIVSGGEGTQAQAEAEARERTELIGSAAEEMAEAAIQVRELSTRLENLAAVARDQWRDRWA